MFKAVHIIIYFVKNSQGHQLLMFMIAFVSFNGQS